MPPWSMRVRTKLLWPARSRRSTSRATSAGRPDPARLHISLAERRHQAKEDENEHLAEAKVAIGPRAAGVEPGGENARGADHEQAQVDRDAQRQSDEPGHAECASRRPTNLLRPHHAGRRGAHRSDSPKVGSAHVVRVVVGKVHAELDADSDD